MWCHVMSCDVLEVQHHSVLFLCHVLWYGSQWAPYLLMFETTVIMVCWMFVGNSEEVTDMKFVSVNLNRLAATSVHCRLTACVEGVSWAYFQVKLASQLRTMSCWCVSYIPVLWCHCRYILAVGWDKKISLFAVSASLNSQSLYCRLSILYWVVYWVH